MMAPSAGLKYPPLFPPGPRTLASKVPGDQVKDGCSPASETTGLDAFMYERFPQAWCSQAGEDNPQRER
jgi:hypothetical protein